MAGQGNLWATLDELVMGALDGPMVKLTLPSESDIPILVEKRLAQFGVRIYGRDWDAAHAEDRTGTFSFKVRRKQFLWAYELVLTQGIPVLAPPPPTNRLRALAANREYAMSVRPQTSWGAPVRNRGFVAFFTNMWRGDMAVGMPPRKEVKRKVKQGIKKELRRILQQGSNR